MSVANRTLQNNLFSGIIPSSFRNLTSLSLLTMQNNRFQGPLPTAIGSLLALTLLYAQSLLLQTNPHEIMWQIGLKQRPQRTPARNHFQPDQFERASTAPKQVLWGTSLCAQLGRTVCADNI